METDTRYRLGAVPTERIKRMPGIGSSAPEKKVRKIRDFAGKRGYYMPVVLSDEGGCMTLLSGEATYKACVEERRTNVPAVIVRTEGGADNLMFALQAAELGESPDAISVSAAIVQLIDSFRLTRKHISESLGKSPAWISRMESLSRNLSEPVRGMVAEGRLSPRSAQEIARLPAGVQMPFAVSVGNEFLSKESVVYLVNRYLNEDASPGERERIVRTPAQALPRDTRKRKRARDVSETARLARAMASCMDSADCLSGLLTGAGPEGAAVRASDAEALVESLAALIVRLRAAVYPGKKREAGRDD